MVMGCKTRVNFVRFNELTEFDINVDHQIHTNWTDGDHTPLEVIDEATSRGLRAISFTEHIRATSDYYQDFYNHIDELRRKSNLEVAIGVETKVLNDQGEMDISFENLLKAEIVLGSVHRILHEGSYIHPKDLGDVLTVRREFELSMAMVRRGNIDVLAHPLGMSVRFYQTFNKEKLAMLIEEIAPTQIAFEINAKYMTYDYFKTIVELCRLYNPHVSIGSDVHQLAQLGNSRDLLEEVI